MSIENRFDLFGSVFTTIIYSLMMGMADQLQIWSEPILKKMETFRISWDCSMWILNKLR